ncbi:siderophore-interacting protein [Streptomyces sp. NPDC059906]|uniref:siderophore-interacting protein n=1 Tax=Streptomyces sp. NPDC059906 TaxID=3346997 RepID=UPI00366525B2
MGTSATTPGTLGDRLAGRLFVRAAVTEVEPVAARMRRIRLSDPRLASLSFTPGQHLRVLVSDLLSLQALREGFRDALRTYSVWHHDPATQSIDLCVLDHGDGPGARWSRQVAVGDDVYFKGPEGKFVLRPAAYHLFVGEETAQVAFGGMLRSLSPDTPAHGVIEVDDEAHRLPLPHAEQVTWLSRHGAGAERSAPLIQALRSLQLPDEPGHAYIAGEAKTCSAARQHLVQDRGWPARSTISVKPFWTPGKRGLE